MTIAELRVPADIHERLLVDVTQAEEWAGYLLCGVQDDGERVVLLGREWCSIPPRFQIHDTPYGLTWHPDFDIEMLNRAQTARLGCVILHYHGGSRPRLSGPDQATCESLLPFLSEQAPECPHAFVVLGDGAAAGPVYRAGSRIADLQRMRVTGSALSDWHPQPRSADLSVAHSATRHDRLVRGFGPAALHSLRRATVGVVGCGGGGSHVIQQLAYLGIGNFVFIDADVVEESNLNRLVGVVPGRTHRSLLDKMLGRGHGDVGRLKIEVMDRLVRIVSEDACVVALADAFPSPNTIRALRGCDVIVACVDRLQVRDDLNRFAKRYLIPLVDVGLEITPGECAQIEAITGRVTKVLADGPCLRCQGIVDDAKLSAERGGQAPGYTGPARIPDPAVVTLNGVVASIAATEVQQIITGFGGGAGPNCGWIYDGLTGEVQRVAKAYRPCSACDFERAAGDV